MIISILITVSSYFELETVNMTGEEIRIELEVNNVTVDMDELLIPAENYTVAVHTELFSDVTYSQLVRLLFNFMSSQVRISQKYAHFTDPRGPINRHNFRSQLSGYCR